MAALDALKQRYGFKRFHLVGQSGGGHTVAGLVQLRSDVGCAVIASGGTSLRSVWRDRGHPFVGKHRFYDPIDHVDAMKQRSGLRLFVVSDRNDKRVSYRSQLEFVERVKAHNLPITHVTATATDKDSHDLFLQGLRLAVDCANEARDQVVVNKGSDQVPVLLRSQPPPPTANPSPQQLAPPASQPKISDRVGQPPMPPQPANFGTGNGILGVLPASSVPAVSRPQAVAAIDSAPRAEPAQQNVAGKPAAAAAHTGWIIQVGALESESEARQRIDLARSQSRGLLNKADPFTEPVVAKDNRKLFRARFAGLERDQAEAVCRTLKRADISCITVRN